MAHTVHAYGLTEARDYREITEVSATIVERHFRCYICGHTTIKWEIREALPWARWGD